MKSPETVFVVNKPFTMIGKRMVAGNGAHPRHLIREIYARNLKGQKTGFTAMWSHDRFF
jgi:hypothetical protein